MQTIYHCTSCVSLPVYQAFFVCFLYLRCMNHNDVNRLRGEFNCCKFTHFSEKGNLAIFYRAWREIRLCETENAFCPLISFLVIRTLSLTKLIMKYACKSVCVCNGKKRNAQCQDKIRQRRKKTVYDFVCKIITPPH